VIVAEEIPKEIAPLPKQRRRELFLYILKSNPLYIFGLTVVTLFLGFSFVVALFPSVLNYNISQINLSNTLRPPSLQFPFGTDDLGRNLFLRVLSGAPLDAEISLSIVVVSLIVGVLTGSVAGYFGGAIDEIIMRITDVFLAFPGLILVVAIAAALGPGFFNAFIALVIVWWPIYTRIARGETLFIKEHQYVLASRASGLGRFRIVREHIIPNVITPMMVYATVDIGNVIIVFSVLGFLGLGAQPPQVDIGRIVYDGQNFLQFAPWYPVIPGLVLFVIVLSFAFTGDFLRDYFDPQMRS
jgi:peptide/nickel transport system permease protein